MIKLISNMLDKDFDPRSLSKQESKFSSFFDSPVVIFPASEARMESIFRYLEKNNKPYPLTFCDNDKNKQRTKLRGIDIVSPEKMIKILDQDTKVLIFSADHFTLILKQLRELGIPDSRISTFEESHFFIEHSITSTNDDWYKVWCENKDKILKACEFFDDDSLKVLEDYIKYKISCTDAENLSVSNCCDQFNPQYFDKDIIKLGVNESFVDAGVCDGHTSVQFAGLTNNSYKNILLFEPDPENYEKSKTNLEKQGLKNAFLFKEGLGKISGTVSFTKRGDHSSKVAANGNSTINVVTLDDKLSQLNFKDNITFIKMDIEGAETDALQGAKKTINKFTPKLAISVYHNPEDIFEIPILLKEYVPEYKLHLRKYSSLGFELICYAVI